MARRNPGISPILSARGYGARVLWPKYTPDGGINSGSEIPVPPRNTLQSNQSNLIYRENPFTPVTQNAPGRIQVTSKRGKTLYMTENQIRKMGSKMLADGEIERALGRSNPVRTYIGTDRSGHSDDYVTVVKARSEKAAKKALREAHASDAERKVPRGSREVSMELHDGEFPYQHHIPARSLKVAKAEANRRGFIVDSASYMKPGTYPFAKTNPRGSGEGPKRRGAFAEFEERVKREMAEAGEYPESDLRSNPGTPDYDRLTPAQMAEGKVHIKKLLDGGMSHADVRKLLGNMSYPKYMAILRSGRTQGAQPVHRGSAHLLRNPW